MNFIEKRTEEEGFEPPVPCGTSVFKTDAFGHSATLPPKSKSINFQMGYWQVLVLPRTATYSVASA